MSPEPLYHRLPARRYHKSPVLRNQVTQHKNFELARPIGYGGSILHLAFVNADCAFVDGLYLPVHRVHTNMVASCEKWHNVCAAMCAIQMDDILPLTACSPILCYSCPYHADTHTLHMQRVQLQTNMCSCRQTASSAMDKVLSHLTTLQTHQQLRVDHLLDKIGNITVCTNQ